MKLAKLNLRFLKEINHLKTNTPEFLTIKSHTESTFTLNLHGAPETIYSGEIFTIQIEINNNYPIDPPTAIFIENIPQNEHVYTNGHICISLLHEDWSPAMTLEMIIIGILSMLSEATKKKIPPDNYLYTVLKRKKSPRNTKWMYH